MSHNLFYELFQVSLGTRLKLSVTPTADDWGRLINWLKNRLKSFGMWRFTQGMMFLMSEVFGMSPDLMLCEPNEKIGKMLLKDILESGNIWKYHSNKKLNRENRIVWHWTNFRRNLGFLSMAPAEILSAPFWSLWHWYWRKKRGIL